MPEVKKKKSSASRDRLLSSIIAILCGLLVGVILLFIFNPKYAATGFRNLLTAGFSSTSQFAKVLYQAAPLMMCGMSVAIAYKASLFNIGAPGQYTVGAMLGLISAIVWQMPWWFDLIMAMVGGALWGLIPGLFKAFFGINEVITAIMFNWIGLFFVNVVLSNIPQVLANYWGETVANRTGKLNTANPAALIPKLGLDELMDSNYMNIAIFLAIALAIVVHILLHKTTFGYELMAVGYNRDAARYAGINSRKTIILSMMIAGGLAGIGGGLYYLGGTGQYVIEKAILSMGFDGIPVALLAGSEPLGTILSALFISYIRVGGQAMQPEFATEYVDVILGTIIYFSAFSLIFQNRLAEHRRKKAMAAEGQQGEVKA